ncbi:hypothetical protein R5R35_005781 [Gryllus longicercus]|uniref:Uncharacterized protein n=1 Tax=Gryllus longicercus TaxID=2509291 RepID=A0AAN9ZFV2_9ORTH
MNEERTPHQIVFSELKCGKRPQQKPKKRWLDMLKQDMREQNINEKEWRKVAANRNEWRRHIQQKTVERQEMQNLEAEERRKKGTKKRKCTVGNVRYADSQEREDPGGSTPTPTQAKPIGVK